MRRPAVLAVSLCSLLTACPKETPPPVEPTPTVTEAPEPDPDPDPTPTEPLRYRGAIELPEGARLEFFVELLPDGDAYGGTLTIPAQSLLGTKLDEISVTPDTLIFSLAALHWNATRGTNGEIEECRFTQGPASLPCTLEPTDAATVAAASNPPRTQTPKPPFPYDAIDVEYDNPTDSVHLAGTLTLPPGPGPHPAALLITGSGPQDRDESLMGHKPFWVLADHLTRQGIAVLRVDDRGVGGSTGVLDDSTQLALVSDVAAGIAHLRANPRIDPARVGVIGHSEGGIIGPHAASLDPRIAFVVMMAGTGVPGHEILREQSVAILRAKGAPATGIELARHQQAKVLQIALDHSPAEARPKLVEIIGDSPQVDMMLTPWFQSFIQHDPRPALEKLRCPVLVLNGELDLQVLPDQNLPEIEKALSGNRQNTTIHRLPQLNHLFQHAKTGSPDEYAAIDETIAPEVLELIGQWVLDQTSGEKKSKAGKKGKRKKKSGSKKKTRASSK